LTYAGGKITVVANDGNDVEPVEVDRLIIGVSETYDGCNYSGGKYFL
jgi:FtsP/CotA-like multicopper oxidase with cupredoxin domain